jgi:hypothetical protein
MRVVDPVICGGGEGFHEDNKSIKADYPNVNKSSFNV